MDMKLEALIAIIAVSAMIGAALVIQAPDGVIEDISDDVIDGDGKDDWQYGVKETTSTTTTTTTLARAPRTGSVDDWKYDPGKGVYDNARTQQVAAGSGGWTGAAQKLYKSASANYAPSPSRMMMESDSMGFAVGGAKDINNFRVNIENDYLPLTTDITYEGLFYDYYFDTGAQGRCDQLFCPSYSYSIAEDPLSSKDDYYLAVGLNSGMKASDFERKKLNLILVLDISGSMSSSFNEYYYDGGKKNREYKTKMKVATESIVKLLDHLEEDDRFGMVVYDNAAYLAKPMREVGDTDMDAIAEHILDLSPKGGTRMSAGMKLGSEQMAEYAQADPEEYENRMIFLTDAQPNMGDTSKEGLLGLTKSNAEKGVYTTFIGIGVDFNTQLIEHITKIKGANYHSVHSSEDFEERMDEGFEYMVTPLVFDLELTLDAKGYEIMKVYGSPEADEATGEIMRVNTLFPSKVEEGQTRGGIVLIKLRKTSSDGTLTLRTSYEDRAGNVGGDRQTVEIKSKRTDYHDNDGIRKGVLLARYADLMKNWIESERRIEIRPMKRHCGVTYEDGICIPYPTRPDWGSWERQSKKLEVSRHYQRVFEDFADHFEDEMDEIGDKTLSKELEILEKLARHGRRYEEVEDDDWRL